MKDCRREGPPSSQAGLGAPEYSQVIVSRPCVPAALDTTKDPCQKVKCSRHKVCIAQGYQRAMCISRKKLEHR